MHSVDSVVDKCNIGVCFLPVGVQCVLYSLTNKAFSFVSIKCLIKKSLYRADEALATRAENVNSIPGTHMVERERIPLLCPYAMTYACSPRLPHKISVIEKGLERFVSNKFT